MRITGYGPGSGGPGSRKDRRKAFKRSHSVGQRVVGAFMGWHDDGLAWVEIDGQPLLAQLEADPQPGQRFLFVIKQLDPDIMLQVLQTGGPGAALAKTAQQFWAARIKFEVATQDMAPVLLQEDDMARRKQLFDRQLQQNPQLAQVFAMMRSAQQEVNALLQAGGHGRLVLAPWLLPKARDFELLVARSTQGEAEFQEVTASFALPKLGHCELRLLLRPPKARFRILAEHPESAAPLQGALNGLASTWGALQLESGGLGYLPPGPRTVLSAFLHDDSQRFLPRFSAHV